MHALGDGAKKVWKFGNDVASSMQPREARADKQAAAAAAGARSCVRRPHAGELRVRRGGSVGVTFRGPWVGLNARRPSAARRAAPCPSHTDPRGTHTHRPHLAESRKLLSAFAAAEHALGLQSVSARITPRRQPFRPALAIRCARHVGAARLARAHLKNRKNACSSEPRLQTARRAAARLGSARRWRHVRAATTRRTSSPLGCGSNARGAQAASERIGRVSRLLTVRARLPVT